MDELDDLVKEKQELFMQIKAAKEEYRKLKEEAQERKIIQNLREELAELQASIKKFKKEFAIKD